MAARKQRKAKFAKGRDQDIYLRGGGWVRTWSSIDVRRSICIEVQRNVYCNRMTVSETRRLIARLHRLLRPLTRRERGERNGK